MKKINYLDETCPTANLANCLWHLSRRGFWDAYAQRRKVPQEAPGLVQKTTPRLIPQIETGEWEVPPTTIVFRGMVQALP